MTGAAFCQIFVVFGINLCGGCNAAVVFRNNSQGCIGIIVREVQVKALVAKSQPKNVSPDIGWKPEERA